MRPGDEFVELFSDIEDVLWKRVASRKRIPFHELVDAASAKDATTRHWRGFLKDVGNLRNAIVHRAHYPREIVADPRPEFIRQLKKVLELIKSPQKIIPRFQRKIRLFAAQDQLDAVLAHMHENDYSQVVVQIGTEFRILSSEGIVRWLSAFREADLADRHDAIVEEVYRHEDMSAQRYMARDETVDAALLAFKDAMEEGIPRLQAILITNSGKSAEKPLGIITPWDLLGLGGNNDVP
jgi:predicted transcriptional regulator